MHQCTIFAIVLRAGKYIYIYVYGFRIARIYDDYYWVWIDYFHGLFSFKLNVKFIARLIIVVIVSYCNCCLSSSLWCFSILYWLIVYSWSWFNWTNCMACVWSEFFSVSYTVVRRRRKNANYLYLLYGKAHWSYHCFTLAIQYKVITTILIRSLDDLIWCAQSVFADLRPLCLGYVGIRMNSFGSPPMYYISSLFTHMVYL